MIKNIVSLPLVFLIFLLCLPYAHAKDGFRLKDRTVEFGLNAGGGVSNSFLSLGDFTHEKMIVDLDTISGGLKINTDINITPLYFMVNTKNNWGFGLSFNIQTIGNIHLSEQLVSFRETVNESPDVGFAVFADTTLDTYFHIQNIKISVKPSVYYTVAYTKPDITYTFITTGTPEFRLDYNTRMYTALKIDDIDNIKYNIDNLSATPGIDISFGILYPFSRVIGIDKKFALFDFDIGVDFFHIPLLASTMRHYVEMAGYITMKGDTIKEFYESFNKDHLFKDETYGEEKITIERPFRTNLYVDWRLFGKKLLTLTPNVGFSVNPMYSKPFSMEYGLKTKLDLANIFLLTAGANYEDRVWKNRVGINLNFRVIELLFAAEARTYKIFRVTNTSGLGVYAGVKFGF